jgi:hypothetical protein
MNVPSSGRICTIATVVYSRAIKSTRVASRRVTPKQSSGTAAGRTLQVRNRASDEREFRRVRRARARRTDGGRRHRPVILVILVDAFVWLWAKVHAPDRRPTVRPQVPSPARPQPLHLVRTLTSGTSDCRSVRRCTARVQCFHDSAVNRGDAIRVLSRNFSLSRRRRIIADGVEVQREGGFPAGCRGCSSDTGKNCMRIVVRSWVGRLRSVTSSMASHKYKCPVYSHESWFRFGCFFRLYNLLRRWPLNHAASESDERRK